MQKYSKFLFTFCLVGGLWVGLSTQVQAETVLRQEQSFSSEVTTDCTSSCNAKVTTDMFQEQHVRIGQDHNNSRHQWSGNGWDDQNRDASVTVSWDFRGGTCQIRYTEAAARGYRYATSAACDDAQDTIGGLVRGRAYRFQVRKDNGAWSRSSTIVAQ